MKRYKFKVKDVEVVIIGELSEKDVEDIKRLLEMRYKDNVVVSIEEETEL